jgi:endonuclease/exonuclease/phosphatase family metal-dependent hydrolase
VVERGETDLRNDFNLNFLESIVMTNKQLLIVGDFNIHTDILDYPDAIKFSDLMESFSLQQHVSGPTHIHGHMLDLIITRQTDRIIKTPPRIGRYISDHASVLCMIHSDKP